MPSIYALRDDDQQTPTVPTNTGWLERQTGMASNHMILLMQAEVERFHAGNLLLHDYYQIKVQNVADENSVVLVSDFLFFCQKRPGMCSGFALC